MLAHGIPHRCVTAVVSSLFAAPLARAPPLAGGAAVGVAAVELIGAPLHAYVFRLPSGSLAFAPILTSYGLGAWLELRRSVLGVTLASGLLAGRHLLADALEPHSGVAGAINAGRGAALRVRHHRGCSVASCANASAGPRRLPRSSFRPSASEPAGAGRDR